MAKKNKTKTRKSVKKRFRYTKKGKVLRRGSHVRHLRRKKNKGQVRKQKVLKEVKGKKKSKIKKALGK